MTMIKAKVTFKVQRNAKSSNIKISYHSPLNEFRNNSLCVCSIAGSQYGVNQDLYRKGKAFEDWFWIFDKLGIFLMIFSFLFFSVG